MCAHKGLSVPLNVNGFAYTARYSDSEEALMSKLLQMLCALPKTGKRKIVFFAGPPGAGKSTFCLSLAELSKMRGCTEKIACVGLDGFHKKQAVLVRENAVIGGVIVPLHTVKGRPETFETEAFEKAVGEAKNAERVFWPVYDRKLHDVSDTPQEIDADILLIEGNWVLSDAPAWERARRHTDLTFALFADKALLKPRLIERKIRGGKTKQEAEAWFERVDGPNIDLFQATCVRSDLSLRLTDEGITLL